MTNEQKYKTTGERIRAFGRFCKGQEKKSGCLGCPTGRVPTYREQCALAWLALEAEEEKPLTCPFCGSVDIKVMSLVRPDYVVSSCYVVSCCNCGAVSRAEATKTDAIAAWNRRAK